MLDIVLMYCTAAIHGICLPAKHRLPSLLLPVESMAPCVARDRWHRAWPAIDDDEYWGVTCLFKEVSRETPDVTPCRTSPPMPVFRTRLARNARCNTMSHLTTTGSSSFPSPEESCFLQSIWYSVRLHYIILLYDTIAYHNILLYIIWYCSIALYYALCITSSISYSQPRFRQQLSSVSANSEKDTAIAIVIVIVSIIVIYIYICIYIYTYICIYMMWYYWHMYYHFCYHYVVIGIDISTVISIDIIIIIISSSSSSRSIDCWFQYYQYYDVHCY